MSQTLSPETTIAQYKIVSKIGEGGMGEVWRARDTKLGRDVAIKVLPAAFAANEERLRRFEQEAQAAGGLNHPNILVIYHIGTHEGAPYIVSELLEGETLRERMAGAAIPQRKALDYGLQFARGLAAAHEKGIIHRDLKPENLFITKDGRLKILDFGLAKLLDNGNGNRSQTDVPTRRIDTEPGVVMGTIGYMSPEQLRGRAADHRSDIFSFGAILYEMLSGRRAFRGESTADTMSAILREDPPDLSTTNRNVAPALERVVNHCLEKNPEERFHSANDLGFAIEALSGSASMADSTVALGRDLVPSRKRLRELIAWTVAGICFLALVVFAALYLRPTERNERAIRFVVTLPEKVSEIASPMISPDGTAVAFVGTLDGKRQLYVRQMDSIDSKPLSGTDDALFPFWSADSRQIGFFSNGKLKKIDVTGGSIQTLCDAREPGGGTWNRDGVILFSSETRPIQRVSAAGGNATAALQLDQSIRETSHFWPLFLPDGNHFLYQSWTGRSEDSGIYVSSLDGRARKLLVKADSNPAYAPPGYLLFARDTTVLAQPFNARRLELSGEPVTVAESVTFTSNFSLSNFSVSKTGVMAFWSGGFSGRQLIWFDRDGKQLALVGPPGGYNDIVLSPDEKRLAIQRLDGGNSDIWLMDLARGLPTRFTFDPTGEDDPVWSPDGDKLAYSAERNGPFDIYAKASSGAANEEVICQSQIAKEGTDWSADGKFMLFDSYNQSNVDVWVLPLFGDRKPYPLLNSPFLEMHGHFSPDGHWIAYTSNESGRNEVYIRRFPQSEGQWQISTTGGAQPHWRKDGKEVFYIAADRKVMAVDLTMGATVEIGTPKPLFQTHMIRYDAPNRYVVSADGQRFLVNSPIEQANQTPITVVLNWTAGLKQ